MMCIYKIRSIVKPSHIYIGSAVNFRIRKNSHKSRFGKQIHHNPILQRHVNKYGFGDLRFSIVEIVNEGTVLLAREQYYLDTLSPKFNISKRAGNTFGTRRSAATCERIRLLKIGNKYNFGRRLSEEHKAKISAANKGRKLTEIHRRRISESASTRNPEAYRKAQSGKRHSEATKKKMSDSASGHKNSRWKGGISNTYRRNIKLKMRGNL